MAETQGRSTVVGFDFGTTNSLMSVVVGDEVIDVLDVDGRPFPSVVRYEGGGKVVGRQARNSLESAGVGVHGTTVLSPKFYLGDESVNVGGVERSPIDIVNDVVSHVRSESLSGPLGGALDGASRAVVTIPITMNGPRRAALRDAFLRADMSIVQFVHEPLAALYGWFRSQPDPAAALRAFDRRNVLVVDWGGGTLDLTLCRVESGRVVQLRNGGSDECGGDFFDFAIRDGVVAAFCEQEGISSAFDVHPDAALRLRHEAERAKIDLSEREAVTIYRPNYFSEPELDLQYRLTRAELESMTRNLVAQGMQHVSSLLDSAGVDAAQVAMVLVTGGMASMPIISGRLHEFFGAQRVVVPEASSTLISQGAAWIAHDQERLRLAKPIEARLARGSFLSLVQADTSMPADREVLQHRFHLYCTDPRDGFAKLEICTPTRPTAHPQRSHPREDLHVMELPVDSSTRPFREHLEVNVSIDENLVLMVSGVSTEAKKQRHAEIHDLEFSLRMPRVRPDSAPPEPRKSDLDDVDGVDEVNKPVHAAGSVVTRANVADAKDDALIPGDLLYTYQRNYFRRDGRATDEQQLEHLYYQPCFVCKRSWSDPECRCMSGQAAS